MPPRKKAKLSSRAPSSPSIDTPKETTPAATNKASQEATRPVLDPDPWTDDQEAALFKNLVRYKPVGLHKHTRMFCILTNLRRYGWQDEHISRDGVWQKLDTLYNMDTLHEREDGDESEAEREDAWVDFWLPSAEFGDAMFSRRINLKRSSSPPTLHHQLSYRGGADVKSRAGAEERKVSLSEAAHKSSPEPDWESGRDGERRRSLRGRGGRGGRGATRVQSEAMTKKRKRAETPPRDQEEDDQEEQESGEDEEENEDEEGSNEDGEEEQAEGGGEEDEEGDEEDDDEEEEEEEEEEEGEEDEEEEEEADEQPSTPANRGGRARSTRTNPQRGRGGGGAGAGGRRGGGGKTRGGRGGRGTPRGRAGRGGRGRGR